MLESITRRTSRITTLGLIAALSVCAGSLNAAGDVFTDHEPSVAATGNVSHDSIWNAAVKGDSATLSSLLTPERWESLDSGLADSIKLLHHEWVHKTKTPSI